MNIEFTRNHTKNENGGINFQAKVEEESFVCTVTTEALQDINPSNRTDSAEQQYLDNQSQLESIARDKILKGEVSSNKVFISASDVS